MIERFLKHLHGNSQGTAAIELGLILPILSMMALASADFVAGFAQMTSLQQHAQSGADFVIANGETIPTTSQVQDQVVALSGLPKSAVTVTAWTECNAAKLSSGLVDCPGLSDLQAQFMKVDVTDTYEPILDIDGIADFVGKRTMKGSATVRLP